MSDIVVKLQQGYWRQTTNAPGEYVWEFSICNTTEKDVAAHYMTPKRLSIQLTTISGETIPREGIMTTQNLVSDTIHANDELRYTYKWAMKPTVEESSHPEIMADLIDENKWPTDFEGRNVTLHVSLLGEYDFKNYSDSPSVESKYTWEHTIPQR